MASGADGLAGLSAVSCGGGAVAHPASRPTAINGIEHRFIGRCGGEVPETKMDFHLVGILDVLRDRQPARCRQQARNKLGPLRASPQTGENSFLAI